MALNLRRGVAVVGMCGACSVSTTARANTASFPPAPPAAPSAAATPPPPSAPAAAPADAAVPSAPEASPAAAEESAKAPPYGPWDAAYAQARAAMAGGDFAHAASSFAQLEESARTPQERAVCAELADLAHRWAQAGLTLSLPRASGAAEPTGVRLNERTTDEISILYLNAVLYGLGTGAWLATVGQPNDAAGVVLPTLALAGAAAGAVALLDHSARLGYGVPASAVTGMYIGLEEGITWSLWNQAKAASFDEWQGSTVATVIWGSATVGAITGAVVGSRAGTTPGRASYVGSTALWGGVLTGFTLAAVTGDERGQRDDASLLGAALGTNAGALAGILSAGPVSPSAARVRFIDLGGIAGGLLGGGLYISAANSASSDSAVQGLFGVTALGMAGGLLTASLLTQSMAPDRGVTVEAKPSALNMQPTLLPVHGGMQLGMLGTF